MIYLWYDENRWLDKRFKGNKSDGIQIIREYTPAPSVVYFRHSYASFRVNGLEFARLNTNGKLRYGVAKAPLEENTITTQQLVRALVHMFSLLADNPARPDVVADWASANFDKDVAHFLSHVAYHHQAEHWLESKLLLKSATICDDFQQVRSQVVVAHQGDGPGARKFIDILALDKKNKLVWVTELKIVKANSSAVSQAKKYVEWIYDNMEEILDESPGYFTGIKNPKLYQPAALFIAPGFSSSFNDYVQKELYAYNVRIVQINSEWRKEIKVEASQEFCPGSAIELRDKIDKKHSTDSRLKVGDNKMDSSRRIWEEDPLTARIIRIARKYNLVPRYLKKYEYIDLCWKSPEGDVRAQIHRYLVNPGGRALIIGNADDNCPEPKHLEGIQDFTQLSGDHGPNKPWLRAEGKTFGHRNPAKTFFSPQKHLKEPDDYPAWKEVEELLKICKFES